MGKISTPLVAFAFAVYTKPHTVSEQQCFTYLLAITIVQHVKRHRKYSSVLLSCLHGVKQTDSITIKSLSDLGMIYFRPAMNIHCSSCS